MDTGAAQAGAGTSTETDEERLQREQQQREAERAAATARAERARAARGNRDDEDEEEGAGPSGMEDAARTLSAAQPTGTTLSTTKVGACVCGTVTHVAVTAAMPGRPASLVDLCTLAQCEASALLPYPCKAPQDKRQMLRPLSFFASPLRPGADARALSARVGLCVCVCMSRTQGVLTGSCCSPFPSPRC